jgi:hypothetical protein
MVIVDLIRYELQWRRLKVNQRLIGLENLE